MVGFPGISHRRDGFNDRGANTHPGDGAATPQHDGWSGRSNYASQPPPSPQDDRSRRRSRPVDPLLWGRREGRSARRSVSPPAPRRAPTFPSAALLARPYPEFSSHRSTSPAASRWRALTTEAPYVAPASRYVSDYPAEHWDRRDEQLLPQRRPYDAEDPAASLRHEVAQARQDVETLNIQYRAMRYEVREMQHQTQFLRAQVLALLSAPGVYLDRWGQGDGPSGGPDGPQADPSSSEPGASPAALQPTSIKVEEQDHPFPVAEPARRSPRRLNLESLLDGGTPDGSF